MKTLQDYEEYINYTVLKKLDALRELKKRLENNEYMPVVSVTSKRSYHHEIRLNYSFANISKEIAEVFIEKALKETEKEYSDGITKIKRWLAEINDEKEE